jgi:acyl-coenzyme A thioesterase PaaI-like protein
MDATKYIERAKHSPFHLWLLNFGLQRMVPFNKPHGFRVTEIGDDHIKISIPYKRKNFNHIRGLHACALATISEYATGLLLLSKLKFDTYRIIMQRLEMNYYYQGKTDAVASFSISPEWLREQIIEPLTSVEAVVVQCEIKIHDTQGKHLTTGIIHWQVKKGANVKTKVAS